MAAHNTQSFQRNTAVTIIRSPMLFRHCSLIGRLSWFTELTSCCLEVEINFWPYPKDTSLKQSGTPHSWSDVVVMEFVGVYSSFKRALSKQVTKCPEGLSLPVQLRVRHGKMTYLANHRSQRARDCQHKHIQQ